MVQPQVQEPPEDTASDPQTVIEDSTQPEQLQRETALAEGRNPDAEVVAPPTETPATPAAVTPQAATPEPTPVVPKVRTYSEDEIRRMQSAKDREIAATRRQAEELQRQLQSQNLEAQVEAYLRSEEQRLATTGLAPDDARNAVRAPEQIKRVRDHFNAQQRVQELEQAQRTQQFEQEVNAMVAVAVGFQKKYNVAEEDMEILMATTTPAAMEKTARRIGRANAERAKAVADLKAQVPAETKTTSLESGMSGTSAPESEDTRLSRLQTVPSWEWSDDDIRFMRRQQ